MSKDLPNIERIDIDLRERCIIHALQLFSMNCEKTFSVKNITKNAEEFYQFITKKGRIKNDR